MFQQWSPQQTFESLRGRLSKAIKEHAVPQQSLSATPEHWKAFSEHVCWKDMVTVLEERLIGNFFELAKPDREESTEWLQAVQAECAWFLHLPDELKQDAELRRAGTQVGGK